jgi:threonine dehydratase
VGARARACPQGSYGGGDPLTALDFRGARAAVVRHARPTPLLPSHELSERLGREVLLKAECLQHTGSFKVRGAAARLEALDEADRRRGVVACSSGNHGRAVAFVAGRLGIPATVYVPEWVDEVKLAGIHAAGAEAVLAGASFDESEEAAEAHARADGLTYVSAYDDPWVIAGQGSIGFEILEQCGARRPSQVLVPLSGGGLAGGIAAALQERLGTDAPDVVAVSAERAAVMLASVRAGRPVELAEEETLANALAGGIGLDNRYSFGLVRDLVAEHPTVSEPQIAKAMRWAVERAHLVVEGGGAVALAALVAEQWRPPPVPTAAPIVVVLSGGNVAAETLVRVLAGASSRPPSRSS